jgi:Cdc6-like AAA superfamily ATPase
MDTMQSWYGLKEGHHDFTIDYDTDANLFFARHDLDEQLGAILKRSFRTGYPPKFVLYGDWGVGKTHTMRHVKFVIETTDALPATVVFVELPDITTKSTFQVAHAALLDALGIDRAQSLVYRFNAQHGEKSKGIIKEAAQSGDIATAFMNLAVSGDIARIAWDWLRGVPLQDAQARLVGLPSKLDQSIQLVRVLQVLGRLSLDMDKKMLVFMLDEATKLGNVSNADAINHWLSAFKSLADSQTKEVGIIVSGAWIEPDDMPLPLQDQQVMTRFGSSNYIPLHPLDGEEAATFVQDLLEEWVEPAERAQITAQYGQQADGEEVEATSFPFTVPALKRMVEYFCRDGGITRPRDIQIDVSIFLNRAIDDDRRIISLGYLNHLIEG